MKTLIITTITFILCASVVLSAPAIDKTTENNRKAKSLQFLDYYQPEEVDYGGYEGYNAMDESQNDYVVELEENDFSRTMPSSKQPIRPSTFNSPIYYIRLPPQPYMFVPGMGYVSQPSPHPVSQFLNLPMSFMANGKPSTIYQWQGGLNPFAGDAPKPSRPPITTTTTTTTARPALADSTIHRLPGPFVFNGKPDDIFILRDQYNSLYSDVLQNFYP